MNIFLGIDHCFHISVTVDTVDWYDWKFVFLLTIQEKKNQIHVSDISGKDCNSMECAEN